MSFDGALCRACALLLTSREENARLNKEAWRVIYLFIGCAFCEVFTLRKSTTGTWLELLNLEQFPAAQRIGYGSC